MRHFKIDEFKCKCCGANKIDLDFVELLDEAREYAEVPFIINSGYRCKGRNMVVGGSPTSSHLKGLAVDIKADNDEDRFLIMDALIHVGIERIGIRNDFIHADIDDDKNHFRMWIY